MLNTSSDDIWVFDAQSLQGDEALAASRSPWALALSPDGRRLLVTNMLARFVRSAPAVSEVTVIDTDRADGRAAPRGPGANLMMGVAWHPSGQFALVTLNRTKNLVPMTRLMQGWTITNGLAVIWRDGGVDQVLLDEPDMGSSPTPPTSPSRPTARCALVTSSGHRPRGRRSTSPSSSALVEAQLDRGPRERLPNHLGKSDRVR